MSIRKSIMLVRLLLLAICFQFAAPAVVTAEVLKDPAHISFASQKQTSKPLSISSLFEKTESEGEEERTKFEAVELHDISLTFQLRSAFDQSLFESSIISAHSYQQPLFRLFCVFLI